LNIRKNISIEGEDNSPREEFFWLWAKKSSWKGGEGRGAGTRHLNLENGMKDNFQEVREFDHLAAAHSLWLGHTSTAVGTSTDPTSVAGVECWLLFNGTVGEGGGQEEGRGGDKEMETEEGREGGSNQYRQSIISLDLQFQKRERARGRAPSTHPRQFQSLLLLFPLPDTSQQSSKQRKEREEEGWGGDCFP
jgi:hypothetical protein